MKMLTEVKMRWLMCAATVLFGLGMKPVQAAAISYSVTVDTSSVSGTAGFLDFQFNPGNSTSQAATAQISSFMTLGGSLSGVPQVNGNVVGTLPGTLTFVNSTALNEYFQGFNYGSSFSFMLLLTGPAISAPNGTANAGTSFGIGLYDNTQNPILTNQGGTTGFAGEVDIDLNGTATATAFPNGTGPSVVTFLAVPEPGTMLMLGLSMAGFVYFRRRA